MSSVPLTDEFLGGVDAVLITTDHTGVDYQWIVDKAPVIVDSRNATRAVTRGREKIVKA